MRNIIIASANRRSAERIKNLLQSGRLFVNNIFSSGSEVLSYASIHPDSVAVCGKLSDMSSVYLAQLLPSGFDLVVLLPSGEAQTAYFSNMVALNMPVNISDLIDTVGFLARSTDQKQSAHAAADSESDRLLTAAKRIMMDRHHISEREAHAFLRHRSMETGRKMTDIALMIIEGTYEIY